MNYNNYILIVILSKEKLCRSKRDIVSVAEVTCHFKGQVHVGVVIGPLKNEKSRQILPKSRNLAQPSNGSRSLRFCVCRSHICFSIKSLNFPASVSDFKMPVSVSQRVLNLPFITPTCIVWYTTSLGNCIYTVVCCQPTFKVFPDSPITQPLTACTTVDVFTSPLPDASMISTIFLLPSGVSFK